MRLKLENLIQRTELIEVDEDMIDVDTLKILNINLLYSYNVVKLTNKKITLEENTTNEILTLDIVDSYINFENVEGHPINTEYFAEDIQNIINSQILINEL